MKRIVFPTQTRIVVPKMEYATFYCNGTSYSSNVGTVIWFLLQIGLRQFLVQYNR